jgi:biotin carboxyl carrier protein
LSNSKTWHAELVDFDFYRKEAVLKINGSKYTVSIADQYDQLIRKMGLSAVVTHKISEIKAPMPGLVLSISIAPGDEVFQGDPLLVLEAMKMENVIKSPGEGKVKKICVTKGQPVDKGEILIELE